MDLSPRDFLKTSGTALTGTALGGLATVGASLAPTVAQAQELRIKVMVVAPDGMVVAPGGTSAINVDLSQVAQSDYAGLVTGDPVLVSGTVSIDRNRVIATSVQRLTS